MKRNRQNSNQYAITAVTARYALDEDSIKSMVLIEQKNLEYGAI
jgi:hypothetical protein